VLDFEPADVSILEPDVDTAGVPVVYRTPASEFALSRSMLADGSSVTLDSAGPQIVLCTGGRVALAADTDSAGGGGVELVLERGTAAWVSASDPVITAIARWGDAEIFAATVGATSG
ncbi:MAG: mannose-6-phosphate isomerase, class I, partial [Rhodococcus sp. (in: high G+C Gram-positive bacteria)]